MRIVALAFAFACAGAAAAEDAVTPTEKLLKDAKIDYTREKAGVYRCVIETKAGKSILKVEERKLAWKDKNDKDILYAFIYGEVLAMPGEAKPSRQLLMRVAEINDEIKFGNVGMNKGKDGSLAFYRSASLNIRGSDAEQLETLMQIVHAERLEIAKMLRGYLEEGKDGK